MMKKELYLVTLFTKAPAAIALAGIKVLAIYRERRYYIFGSDINVSKPITCIRI